MASFRWRSLHQMRHALRRYVWSKCRPLGTSPSAV